MERKTRLLLAGALALLLAVAVPCSAPILVATIVRIWVWQNARQQNLSIEIRKIDAPFLRPVILHDVQLSSRKDALYDFGLISPRVLLDLNCARIFHLGRARILRSLTVDNPHLTAIRTEHAPSSNGAPDWNMFRDLLADNWSVRDLSGRIQSGNAVIDFQHLWLSGSELEPGQFTAGSITVVSPLLRTTFKDLRGATNWIDNRFIVGAVTLTRGLDIQSMTIDLANLDQRRLALEFDIDAFGGNLRASISNEERQNHRMWNVAGSAGTISLAQLSEALGFTEAVKGSVASSKFTFRGEMKDLAETSASVWLEVTGLTWRTRTAETIIFGASLYNRQIEVEQLYIKQHANELTLNGESSLPTTVSEWLKPAFRGDISATIRDLGEFVALLGANARDYAGEITLSGTVAARDRVLSGSLSASGRSLTFSGVPVDALEADLSLSGEELELHRLELLRNFDFIRGSGRVDVSRAHNYSGTMTAELRDIGVYAPLLPERLPDFGRGAVKLTWTGDGNVSKHYGTVHAEAEELSLVSGLASSAFNLEAEAVYSPESVFFSTLHLANDRASFDAFATLARNYVQLQTIRFTLAGKPGLEGNFFIPFSFDEFKHGQDFLRAIESNSNLDIDLRIAPTELGELGEAIGSKAALTGTIAGAVAVYGTLTAPEASIEAHVQDVATGDAIKISGEATLAANNEEAKIKAEMALADSPPLQLSASWPFAFDANHSRYSLERDKPVSAFFDGISIPLAKVPTYLRPGWINVGSIGGKLTIDGTAAHPTATGNLQIQEAGDADGILTSGKVEFAGPHATLNSVRLRSRERATAFRGSIDFQDSTSIVLQLGPFDALRNLSRAPGLDCIDSIALAAPPASNEDPQSHIKRAELRGSLFARDWKLTLIEAARVESSRPESADKTQLFELCEDGQPLLLGVDSPSR